MEKDLSLRIQEKRGLVKTLWQRSRQDIRHWKNSSHQAGLMGY